MVSVTKNFEELKRIIFSKTHCEECESLRKDIKVKINVKNSILEELRTNRFEPEKFDKLYAIPALEADKIGRDGKEQINHKERSPIEIGCWYNLQLQKPPETPIDVLIIAEGHSGGGNKEEWRKPQREEINKVYNWYMPKDEGYKSFFNFEMHELLKKLDENEIKWFFTDLIKCHISIDKKKGKKCDNFLKSFETCRQYLNKQIEFLEPNKILCLGKFVTEQYFKLKMKGLKHGDVFENQVVRNHHFTLVYSTFPSSSNADNWAINKGWKPIIEKLLCNK